MNHTENLEGCLPCHKSRAQQDFVRALERIETAK
jgi:hypothetical protein